MYLYIVVNTLSYLCCLFATLAAIAYLHNNIFFTLFEYTKSFNSTGDRYDINGPSFLPGYTR